MMEKFDKYWKEFSLILAIAIILDPRYKIYEESITSSQKSQLQLYLDEPKVDRKINLNVLAFWKANQFQYPELSILARDVLSIPISTVTSEASFSVGGRVIDQYHSTLKPENVEAEYLSWECDFVFYIVI
ncbi:hypothetical protein L3X38_041724 [Prunus dulcis]|uniref:Lectin protein kinase family protein n=1 Tax=Prunus dulcis TaxID=3755 RepID=A0AAD4UUW3_PRUDU|nr:hypothetical protein L3X38_041724 [Prunus dulcis]